MSKKVIVSRWPDDYTLIGPPVIVLDLDEAAKNLAVSGFMTSWVAEKIKEAMLDGVVFTNTRRLTDSWKGRADGVVSEYKVASQEEALVAANSGATAHVTGKVSKRAQEKQYEVLRDDSVGSSYHSLPRQAKVILDVLAKSGVSPISEAGIEHVLVENAELLKTRQEPMKIFAFYRRPFLDGGHLKELS
jgi:hypothetical protein